MPLILHVASISALVVAATLRRFVGLISLLCDIDEAVLYDTAFRFSNPESVGAHHVEES